MPLAGQAHVISTTIFLSAFLLFLVQPIVAKLILPRFGGGVAVWATCLVFFQLALLLGYLYAHAVVQHDRRGRWRTAHIALLLASLLTLPILPRADGPALAALGPSAQVIALLVVTIGLPFVLLATTSPLLQAWLARGLATRQGPAWRDPYRLFVVSNLASLVALLAYPWGIEPWLGNALQAHVWSWLYAGYVVLAAAIAWRARAHDATPVEARASADAAHAPIAASRVAGWIALAALASYELVAVTNHLTQNIPSMPLMWVLPLVAYLLTFTLCFDGERWYRPRLYRGATLVAVVAMCWLLSDQAMANRLALQCAVFVIGLFVICMHCHGELARDRPPARQLTTFYLCVAAGGALGGAAVGLAAPALLPGYFEVEIGLVLVMLAVLWRSSQRSRVWAAACATVAVCAAATAAYRYDRATGDVVAMHRNFYGVLRVQQYGGRGADNELERTLVHGSILHGQQFLSDESRRRPTSYYVETSGIGRLLSALDDRPLQVGVVGLGAGTIAAYGKAGDRYRFYEINPAVADIAQRYFTFLSDSQAQVDIAIGDGRLLLQRPDEPRFDVLAIDAFSGDSIPVHLLTREAVALYLERLQPHGVLALHVSNRHIDLRPVVARIAADRGLQLAYVEDKVEKGDGEDKSSSDWILLARDRTVLDLDLVRDGSRELPNKAPQLRLWSDDYSNIVQVMSLTKPISD